jgi:hypothetical protein
VATARALAELVDSPMPTGAGAAGAVALRRTALEGLGLALAGLREASQAKTREELQPLLERQLHADALDLLVESQEGWAEHDRRLPLLQGASRGLQLAASADLPLLGSGPGRAVPMLTLAALQEGEALRIRTQVVTPSVWQLPLPSGEQLELVLVPGGEARIGSPETEEGRSWYENQRDGCKGVNAEAERTLRLAPFAMVRHAITQAQWRAVAELPQVEKELNPTPGTYKPDGLWETHAQPGALPVDSISRNDCKAGSPANGAPREGTASPLSSPSLAKASGRRPAGQGRTRPSTSATCSMPPGPISMAATPMAPAAKGCTASGRCRWASLAW